MIFFFPRDMWSIAGGYTYYIYINAILILQFQSMVPFLNDGLLFQTAIKIEIRKLESRRNLEICERKFDSIGKPSHCRYFIPIYP